MTSNRRSSIVNRKFSSLVRPEVGGFEPYLPGRSLESVRREFGLTQLYKLASNENALGPSRKALAAIAKVGAAFFRYPDGSSAALRAALATHAKTSAQDVIIGAGSDELIELLGKTFLNSGDSIVVSDHAFIRYRMAAELMGAGVITVPMREMTHDLAAMAAAIQGHTKLLFIANPNNPTGTYNATAELERLLARVKKLNRSRRRPILVVVDEAYYEYACALAPDYPRTLTLRKRYANLVVLRTFSKIHALAGLRVGYGFADPQIIQAMDRVRPPFNVSTAAQVAALASLADAGHLQRGVALVRAGRRQLWGALKALDLVLTPSVGNFVLIDVGPRRGSAVFAALLRRGIIVRSMDEYGFPQHIRVTFGLPRENAGFLRALKEVVSL